jgi:hypothetical protein
MTPTQPLQQVEPIIHKHTPTWKEGSVYASGGCHGNQPASLQRFPGTLIIQWLMKSSREALSLSLWKPPRWAHYDESRSKRE